MTFRTEYLKRAALLLMLLTLAGCSLSGPPSLDPATVQWKSTALPSLGVTVSHPDLYSPAAVDGAYVPFRYKRFTPLIIRWVGEGEGRKAGLWFAAASAGAIQLGGVPGQKYIYTHYDGFFGARMIAWVIPWRGKFLAVEIRTNGDLDPVQEQIMERFSVGP
jgi:predicted small lipoprotein YifL